MKLYRCFPLPPPFFVLVKFVYLVTSWPFLIKYKYIIEHRYKGITVYFITILCNLNYN